MSVRKIYVKVNADFETDGKITPRAVKFESGYTLKIRKITAVTRAASLKAGGQGTRYTCMAGEVNEFYLFYEEPRWFVEGTGCEMA